MAEKFTNITDPKYRCSIGACPAVYKSEDGKTFTIIGACVVSQIADKAGPGEEAVDISADLLLSSLGVSELVTAAKRADELLHDLGYHVPLYLKGDIDKGEFISSIIGLLDNPDQAETFDLLREALSRIKGGK